MITINVGKRGISEGLIEEINRVLEKHGEVKVKMLRNFRMGKDRREIAKEIAKHVKGKLLDLRGFVLTFKR